MESYSAYRTTIQFPQNVKTVKIWTTDAAEIEVGGKHYSVDETNYVKLSPNTQSQLVISIDAANHGLAAPGIKLQTDSMQSGERVVIHPDEEIHQRLANLNDNHQVGNATVPELYAAQYTPRNIGNLKNPKPQPLVDQSKYTADDTKNIQGAIKQLMTSVSYNKNDTSIGQSTRRGVSSKSMEIKHFMLDLGVAPFAGVGNQVNLHPSPNGKTVFKALNQTGATGADTVDFYMKDAQDLETSNKAGLWFGSKIAHKISGGIKSGTEDVGHATKSMAEDAGNKIKEGAEDTASGLKHLGNKVANGTVQVTHVAVTTMDDAVKSVKGVVHYVEDKVQKAVKFVVDTVHKAVKLVEMIVQQIGAAIEQFLQWLQFLFEWKEILHTQKVLVDSFNNALTFMENQLKGAEVKVDGFFANMKEDISDVIDAVIGDNQVASANKIRKRKGLSPLNQDDPRFSKMKSMSSSSANSSSGNKGTKGQEKISWLLSKATDHAGSSGGSSKEVDTGAAGFVKLFTNISDRLNDAKMQKAFEESLAYFKEAAKSASEAPVLALDGILEASKGFILALLDVLDGLVIDFLEIVEMLIEAFKDAINKEWNIPVISDLFELLTDSKLTLLDFAALLLAIPVTVLSKIFSGEAPFKNYSALQMGIMDSKGWGYCYASCAFALGILSPTNDLIGFVKSAGRDQDKDLGGKQDGGQVQQGSANKFDNITTGSLKGATIYYSVLSGGINALLNFSKITALVMMKVATYPAYQKGGADRSIWFYHWGLIAYDLLNTTPIQALPIESLAKQLRALNTGLGIINIAWYSFGLLIDGTSNPLKITQGYLRTLPRASKVLGLPSLVDETYSVTLWALLAIDLSDLGVGGIALDRTITDNW